MKIKYFIIFPIVTFVLIFGFIILGIAAIDEDEGNNNIIYQGVGFDEDVLKHRELVLKYTKEYGIEEYVNYILAIIQVESGGRAVDVMQSSESLGLSPNSLSTEESIKQGCKYFSELYQKSLQLGCDILTIVQAYNYGGGFVDFVATNGKQYTFALAQEFSSEKAGGERVEYNNEVAIAENGGWRYNYGNMFYVRLVSKYLTSASFDDETVQSIMNEALKYEGWKYVYGGSSPTTSFDCSGLTQWCYAIIGLNLPRTAQEQYDACQKISLDEAKPGDLLFFHSTYISGTYVSHVGIYVGDGKMYHAGDPIGYVDINTAYWRTRLIGAGRYSE